MKSNDLCKVHLWTRRFVVWERGESLDVCQFFLRLLQRFNYTLETATFSPLLSPRPQSCRLFWEPFSQTPRWQFFQRLHLQFVCQRTPTRRSQVMKLFYSPKLKKKKSLLLLFYWYLSLKNEMRWCNYTGTGSLYRQMYSALFPMFYTLLMIMYIMFRLETPYSFIHGQLQSSFALLGNWPAATFMWWPP